MRRLARAVVGVAFRGLGLYGALLFLAPAVRAQTTWQGTATVAGGWTDDKGPTSTTATPAATSTPDLYGEVRPTLSVSVPTRLAAFRLKYGFSGIGYLGRGWAYTNSLQLNAMIEPRRDVAVVLSLEGVEGQNSVVLSQPEGALAATGMPEPVSNSTATVVNIRATQGLWWDITPRLRLLESVGYTAFLTVSPRGADNHTVDPGVELARLWARDTLGGEVHVPWVTYGEVRGAVDCNGVHTPDAIIQPVEQQIMPRLLARWRHDFGRHLGMDLAGGVNETELLVRGNFARCAQDPVVVPPTFRYWAPAAQAALRYIRPGMQLEVAYNYGILASTNTGRTLVGHTARVRGSVPFGWKSHVELAASAGYQRAEVLDTLGAAPAPLDIVSVDATLTWTPRAEISVYARYQLIDQITTPSVSDPNPPQSFLRNLVVVGITGRYPAEGGVEVARALPTRADAKDLVPLPSLHSPEVDNQASPSAPTGQ